MIPNTRKAESVLSGIRQDMSKLLRFAFYSLITMSFLSGVYAMTMLIYFANAVTRGHWVAQMTIMFAQVFVLALFMHVDSDDIAELQTTETKAISTMFVRDFGNEATLPQNFKERAQWAFAHQQVRVRYNQTEWRLGVETHEYANKTVRRLLPKSKQTTYAVEILTPLSFIEAETQNITFESLADVIATYQEFSF